MFNLIEYGLALQAASLNKGTKESVAAQVDSSALESPALSRGHEPAPAADPVQPKDYVDQDYCPVDRVCPSCGTKYVGFSCPRSACKE